MAIDSVNKRTLTFIFSIVKEPKSGEWGVMVKENYVEKGTKVGPLRLSKSKEHFVGGATMVFNEAGLQKKVASLRNSAVYDVTAYEKSLGALQAFKATPSGEGYEILRQTNTFDIEGNRLTGKKAVLHTVEKDDSGAETSSAKVFKPEDMARFAFQSDHGADRIWHVGFYYDAAKKIGSKVGGTDITELLKPFKFEPR